MLKDMMSPKELLAETIQHVKNQLNPEYEGSYYHSHYSEVEKDAYLIEMAEIITNTVQRIERAKIFTGER